MGTSARNSWDLRTGAVYHQGDERRNGGEFSETAMGPLLSHGVAL
jgi:hypothetical protein